MLIALIEPVCSDIKNPRKRRIRGDLNSGMWTVLQSTDSHQMIYAGFPIITRELAMNKKLSGALKIDFQEQNKMKCNFCPTNDAHFTLDDQVNSQKWQVTGLIHPYQYPTCPSDHKISLKVPAWPGFSLMMILISCF